VPARRAISSCPSPAAARLSVRIRLHPLTRTNVSDRILNVDGGHRAGPDREAGRGRAPAALPPLTGDGAEVIKIPARAPRTNAIADRFVGSVHRELLDQILIINAAHARRVLSQYEERFNTHRPHRALGQATPLRPLPCAPADPTVTVVRRDRLGGLLHEYTHAA
jgi:putative transposase